MINNPQMHVYFKYKIHFKTKYMYLQKTERESEHTHSSPSSKTGVGIPKALENMAFLPLSWRLSCNLSPESAPHPGIALRALGPGLLGSNPSVAMYWVTLGMSLDFAVPQFPLLWNGDNNCLLHRASQRTCECSEQCLTNYKLSLLAVSL